MPHIPDFPSPSDDADDDRKPERRSIVDRIIGDGHWPTSAAPRPEPVPASFR
ncbi:hypothetical protein [Haloterrigena salifodinae]|uniref:Uncharacterized protein n=1 Tax=Haloterrigena salifodinae TaxID=2675099 RepID=A0A8T8DX43_9EURY|nr:hypothetical protein [Haloterrigena salifodinae]QRV14158.1 hypothetical protein JMJ58_14570 [Haloterrigena salifodinae]